MRVSEKKTRAFPPTPPTRSDPQIGPPRRRHRVFDKPWEKKKKTKPEKTVRRTLFRRVVRAPTILFLLFIYFFTALPDAFRPRPSEADIEEEKKRVVVVVPRHRATSSISFMNGARVTDKKVEIPTLVPDRSVARALRRVWAAVESSLWRARFPRGGGSRDSTTVAADAQYIFIRGTALTCAVIFVRYALFAPTTLRTSCCAFTVHTHSYNYHYRQLLFIIIVKQRRLRIGPVCADSILACFSLKAFAGLVILSFLVSMLDTFYSILFYFTFFSFFTFVVLHRRFPLFSPSTLSPS